jgi:hypothetical protein
MVPIVGRNVRATAIDRAISRTREGAESLASYARKGRGGRGAGSRNTDRDSRRVIENLPKTPKWIMMEKGGKRVAIVR